MEARFREMLLALSPARRVAMCCDMFLAAKGLVRAGIVMESAGREPEDIRERIFLRLYGHELSEISREAVLRWMRARKP